MRYSDRSVNKDYVRYSIAHRKVGFLYNEDIKTRKLIFLRTKYSYYLPNQKIDML